MVHSTEKQLEENGDKVDASLKGEIETAVSEAKEALESDDLDAMKAKSDALTQVAMKMGQAIYEQDQATGADAAADAAASEDTASPAEEEEVVDAEFTEVDDENKS